MTPKHALAGYGHLTSGLVGSAARPCKKNHTVTETREEVAIPVHNYYVGAASHDARMTGPGESRKEARLSMSIIFNAKTFIKIATWKVRTLYQCGRTERVIKYMENYKIYVLGVSEMRWTGQGRMDSRGKTVLYSGKYNITPMESAYP